MKEHHSQMRTRILISFVGMVFSLSAYAEEGMWTFDNPPGKQLQEKYGFAIAPQWLDHVRLCQRALQ